MPSESTISKLRIFVSSPGDVAEERALAERVLGRLRGEFGGRATLEPFFWEHEPLVASASFQEQIVRPSETDIVATILWSRLGTRLPPDLVRADGSRYESGTEFEFEDALEGHRETGRPDLLVYRKTAEAVIGLGDKQAAMARLRDQEAVDAFVETWFENQDDGSLVAAFHPFESPGEFEELFETHLRELILRRLPEVEEVAARRAAIWREGSPFRGLESFEPEHAPVFFGRGQAVADVLQALRRQAAEGRPFVLVLGMSGGGKSSLVKAGVLPLLSQPGVIEGVGLWRTATMIPSEGRGDLFESLASALVRDEALPWLDSDATSRAELATVLRESPAAAVPLIKAALAQAARDAGADAPPATKLALVLDQLEEIFTLDGIDLEQREAFMRAIDALVRSGQVWVLATLRSDFFPHCGELEALEKLKQGAGQYDLAPPRPAEIGQMIRRPALAAGLRFDRNDATDEGLDDVLRDATGSAEASLPLLQFTLEELYKRRTPDGVLTFEAFHDLGGVEGALAKRAEETFSQLQPSAQATLPRVFRSLVRVDPDRGLATSRRADIVDVGGSSPAFDPAAQAAVVAEGATYVRFDDGAGSGAGGLGLVDAFVDARLFATALSDDGRAVVKVAHEALLRHWPRLVAWLEKDRENLRRRARLAAAAARWHEGERASDFLAQSGQPLDEARELQESFAGQLSAVELAFVEASVKRERGRRLFKRAIAAALAALSLVAAIAAVVATRAQRESEQRRGQAEDLIGFMLGDLKTTLDSVGRLDAMGTTADKVLEYLGSLDDDEQQGEALARRAEALRQIGEVRFQQGQVAEAERIFEGVVELAQALVDELPTDRDRRADLADSHFWLGNMHFVRGELEAAFQEFENQRSIYSDLAAEDPTDPRWRLELELAFTNLGYVFAARGETERALDIQRQRLTVVEDLVASEPTNQEWQLKLATTHSLIGELLERRGDLAGALEHHRLDLEIAQALVASDPADARWLERRQNSLAYVGSVLAARGETQLALEHFRQQVEDLQGLVAIDPSNATWRTRFARAERRVAFTLAALAPSRNTIALLRDTLDAFDQRQPGAPAAEPAPMSTDAAWTRWMIATVLTDRGDLAAAQREALRAHAALERLAGERPNSSSAKRRLGQSHTLLGRILDRTGDAAGSRERWERAAEVIAPLATDSSDPVVLAPWATILLALERGDEARPVLAALGASGYAEARFTHLATGLGAGEAPRRP